MTNLLDLPHSRARSLLAGGAPVYLPVNPVEYHGPHLSLHNDALISRGLASDIHEGLCARGHDYPFLITSDLEIGVDPCAGPGSRSIPYGQAVNLVVEACTRLSDLGAQRVVLVTFHGSPLHSLALHEGVRALERRGVRALSPLNLILKGMLELDVRDYADAYDTIRDPEQRAIVMGEATLDVHAGFLETSLALHHAPMSVDERHVRLPPCPEVIPDAKLRAASQLAARLGRTELARELAFAAFGTGWHALRPFPGYTSRPSLASREAGAMFAKHMKREFAELTHNVLFEGQEAPAPIMGWLRGLTMGGRLTPPAVPLAAVKDYDAELGVALDSDRGAHLASASI
jgi:creatinine amidohydrolase